ncbi:Septum formation initiator [Aliarcobacter thereius]|uniref:Septum formation initiator n=2 Tax=Aliarcobacter thereius TaxID=544718 RepID=A0A1C0B8U6_9BACT|nr:septum formation initiator family protein [Aliarcobacter thereius]OCL87464.1 Septum formation initiator [Aliarcobacter thereius]OCL93706.1 Septum formation initiator [Aliarcobacter thereius]OCL95112.1 Septum formation initiator [Aliarcobacter thereius LMG 24486]OCL99987.1 Septum formation initiator [Aliarcobacter thereius]QBF16898.1 hypothetical protein ATH_1881 [Aliarcobacter thereius LMG 24486]
MKIKSEKARFAIVSIVSVIFTLFLAYHFAILLFGANSFIAYDSLKNKKVYLESEISRLQRENARLQKEYFELKNLEPEE